MLQALGDMLSTGKKANAAVRKHQVKPVRIYFVISLTNAKNPVNRNTITHRTENNKYW